MNQHEVDDGYTKLVQDRLLELMAVNTVAEKWAKLEQHRTVWTEFSRWLIGASHVLELSYKRTNHRVVT